MDHEVNNKAASLCMTAFTWGNHTWNYLVMISPAIDALDQLKVPGLWTSMTVGRMCGSM